MNTSNIGEYAKTQREKLGITIVDMVKTSSKTLKQYKAFEADAIDDEDFKIYMMHEYQRKGVKFYEKYWNNM